MTPRLARPSAAIPALLATFLAGCQDSSNPIGEAAELRFGSVAGSLPGGPADAGTPARTGLFIEDAHEGGQAARFELASVAYGRLVELWGKDATGLDVRVARDFVIGEHYVGDGVQVRLDSQAVVGTPRLMIDARVDGSPRGSERFLRLASAAADSVTDLEDAGSGSSSLTHVPRNAALVMRFTDLVDPGSLDSLAAMIRVGTPAVRPFSARVAPHGLTGGIDASTGQFQPTRVVVDLTVDEREQARTEEALGLNVVGLPAASGSGMPDAELRLPTQANAGIGRPIMSSGGTALSVGSGTVDYSSSTIDIVRPFGAASPGSTYLGFLMDTEAPRLVAEAQVQLTAAPMQQSTPDLFVLPSIEFMSPGCAGPAQVGDIVSQPGVVAEVVMDSGPSTAGVLDTVMVRLLEFPASWTGPEQWETDGAGVAFYQAPYDVAMDDERVACLVQPFPAALGFPSAPTRGVNPQAGFQLRFNEPIADVPHGELESVIIGRSPIAAEGAFDPREAVVAPGETFGGSSISGGYIAQPVTPLAHASGVSEVYYLTPRLGPNAVRDLAGNVLEESPGPIAMSIDPDAGDIATGGALLSLQSANELGNAGADVSGQIVRDFSQDVVRPRPVIRFQSAVDNTQPLPAQMTSFPAGVQTPFTPLGARMQSLWRYADMGLGLTDPTTINIDVEGMYWSPSGGAVVADSFAEFEISLSHARWAPDEYIDPTSLFPQFRNSGLRPDYANNVLPDEAPTVVHPRALGYEIMPQDVMQTSSGRPIVPFPMNRVTGEPTRTFTWRDSTVRGRAGGSNAGVPPWSYSQVLGLPIGQPVYPSGDVQTIGLPLLYDISTFSDSLASGSNAWVLNLAVNSSSRPYFRAFSSGGVDSQGSTVVVDPSMETTANGGFSPGSTPPGQPTFGRDNSFMLGAADFVIRKSVLHSVWIDAGSFNGARQFSQPVLSGASMASASLDVRGAAGINYSNSGGNDDNDSDGNGVADMLENADLLDLYGDFYNHVDQPSFSRRSGLENPGIAFAGVTQTLEGSDWRANAATILGARFVQVRVTLLSDVATGETPSVGAIGVAWTE